MSCSRFANAGVPLAAAVGAGAGGVITTGLQQRYGSRRGLRLLPLIGLPGAALLLLLAVHAASPYWAIGALTACFGSIELSEGPFWAAAMTVGRSNTMVVSGLMNTGGNLGGIIGIPIVAALTGHGAWNLAFLIGAGCGLVQIGRGQPAIPPDSVLTSERRADRSGL